MNFPDTLIYRPARMHEASALAQMSRDLIEAGLDWRYTATRMAALVRDAETTALVACDEVERIQGFAIMQFGDERAHLALLCVQPARQRRGVGRRLLDWLIESAQVAGMASVRLELRADNAAGLAFYRALGFVETHPMPDYYGAGIAARAMLRRLRPDDAAAQ